MWDLNFGFLLKSYHNHNMKGYLKKILEEIRNKTNQQINNKYSYQDINVSASHP